MQQMKDFRMPSLGADMEGGTLVEWLKSPGDAIHRGDIIAVVETVKGAIEIECFDEGAALHVGTERRHAEILHLRHALLVAAMISSTLGSAAISRWRA
mgnify:CR=1 FL=1